MATIVGGVGVPHTPMFPEMVAREGPQSETGQLFAAVADQLDALEPDVLVVFDSDHLNTFFLDNLPTFCVGVSTRTAGPIDRTPGLVRQEVPVDEAFGRHLLGSGLSRGFDLSMTQHFEVDHSVLVPLHFLTPELDVPIVPVFVNGMVAPLPGARRCLALGEMVREAIERYPADVRVAVVASGGFSLDIGGHRSPPGEIAGVADRGWAERMFTLLSEGRVNDLLNEATAEQIARAGNVAGELLNWVSMLGAVGAVEGKRPSFLEPQFAMGHAYGAWRLD